jgi:6-pyruvoyltetrahydropterin/6-carboxytetrahydropterin synthase
MAALEFTRRYAMAHRLLATQSPKCAIPHGHNEFVTIRLDPIRPFTFNATNSAAPFELVKRRWRQWIDEHVDHALHLGESDPLIGYFRENEPALLKQIMTFQGDPTTEALAACFFLKLAAFVADDQLPSRCARSGLKKLQRTRSWWRATRSILRRAACARAPGPGAPTRASTTSELMRGLRASLLDRLLDR